MAIPSEMRAWVLEAPGRLALRTVPVPTIGPNQVLVKIDAACMCNGSDPGIYRGHEAYSTPMIFGHEASGRVVEVGGDVKEFKIGERLCWWCEMGAFAEYQAVTPGAVAAFRVPDNLTVDEAPVLELVIASCRALMALPPGPGRERLLIVGLGPSGLTLTQYARVLGYKRVVGWDLYPERREKALALGADEAYDPVELTLSTSRAAPKDMGEFDVGVDMMGDDMLPGEPTLTAMMRALRQGGTVVSYGHPESGRRFSPFVFQSRGLTMTGPVNDMAVIREQGARVMRAVAEGGIRIAPIISRVLPFTDFQAAFDHLLARPMDQIKVILKW